VSWTPVSGSFPWRICRHKTGAFPQGRLSLNQFYHSETIQSGLAAATSVSAGFSFEIDTQTIF
jgi:hypothetical protein